ncbi:MAG TPA: leucyl aminopeptidase family protein, partial [Cytophagaceae bacterium]|nr:leucyl aminopeptidase family protein [Cytophagaceae bacterium]
MKTILRQANKISSKANLVILIDKNSDLSSIVKKNEETAYIRRKIADETIAHINHYFRNIFFVKAKKSDIAHLQKENFRRAGFELCALLQKQKIKEVQVIPLISNKNYTLDFLEGLLLSDYQFLKYKTDKDVSALSLVELVSDELDQKTLSELSSIVEATYIARDLVNEPVIFLTAEQLSKEIVKLGKEAGFHTEVFHKTKIESLGMGGLLNVNRGSKLPPTFTILEYRPAKNINKNPFVLVGKGVVYDTGGLSLKPADSMSIMKCDMAGAAAVAATIYAIAKNKLPIYVVGLIPATDNRPGENAVTPGDVITMFNRDTVEVLNTDAEGRLILADALSYASKYKPKLVIDLATLTGSALRAIGKEGIVYMGNASEKTKKAFTDSGNEVYERLVEFPLWEEYSKQNESDIADIKNLGSGDAGAITAGKFLEHFV